MFHSQSYVFSCPAWVGFNKQSRLLFVEDKKRLAVKKAWWVWTWHPVALPASLPACLHFSMWTRSCHELILSIFRIDYPSSHSLAKSFLSSPFSLLSPLRKLGHQLRIVETRGFKHDRAAASGPISVLEGERPNFSEVGWKKQGEEKKGKREVASFLVLTTFRVGWS